MYTILVKDTNELIVSVKERIVQRNKLVDSLHFLASQTYKGEDMSSYSVLLEYKLPVSKAYKTAMLELTDELYKDMLEYKLPFDTEFTKEPGDVEVQLTFFKNEMGEDGVITQRVRHTTSTYIHIVPLTAWSDLIPDDALSAIDQRLLKADAQAKQLADLIQAVDDNHIDNLVYKDGYLQLSKGGVAIGDKVYIANGDDPSGQGKSATETAATDATNKVNEAKTELQKQIDAKVASVFKFKGSLDNKTALDAIEGMIVGDVYHTSDDGKEYVYTGEGWELLGFTIDLSAYATTESVTKAINDKFNELTKSLENYYNKDQIDGKVTELTGAIATAKQEAITAAATDAQSKADKALSDAKAYADGLNGAMDTRVKVVEGAVTWAEIA